MRKTVEVTINMDAETKQQVEAAAAEKHMSVNDYLLDAVNLKLADGQSGEVTSHLTTEESLQLMGRIAKRREKILAERNGEFIDVNAIIDQIRDEHDAELYGLR